MDSDLLTRWSRKNFPGRQRLSDFGLVFQMLLDAFGLWVWTLGFTIQGPSGNRNGTCCVIAAYHFLPVLGRPLMVAALFLFPSVALQTGICIRVQALQKQACILSHLLRLVRILLSYLRLSLTKVRQTLPLVYVLRSLQRRNLGL
jgi:hypothetical protein